jgi:hypothetical protein
MPQLPLIVPIIVTGVLVGSLMKSKTQHLSKKRLVSSSLISGVLNGAYAYAVYLLTPQTTFTRFTGSAAATAAAAFRPASDIVFIISSFVAGVLFVLTVIGIAMVYARFFRGGGEENLEEVIETSEPEAESISG